MTFLMTNMIPQAPRNNRETWEGLESYTRSLIKEGNEAYIVAGTYGSGGTGASGYMEAIHNGNILINVPSHFWKIIVVIPNGSDDLNRIKPDTRVIAIDTPNDNSLNSDWKKYRTSVHAIEEATGYHLLTNLPLEVRTALELKVDHL
jgi:endonuclease G